jgi:hypothetical protein
MNRIFAALSAAVLAVLLLIPAAPAHAAWPECSRVWLTSPSYFDKIDTGQRRCLWPKDRTEAGWVKVYRLDDRSLRVIDYVSPYNITATPPNNGRVKSTADSVRALASRYDIRLQFAVSSFSGQRGCYGDHIGQISGMYAPGGDRYPGRGLVRLGTGTIDRCMEDKRRVMDITRHELTHGILEKLCGRYVGTDYRHENVTDAYAWKYLGATVRNPGGYGFGPWSLKRAVQIHDGNC